MTNPPSSQRPERLLSLDFFRGATMFLLIAEFTHFFSFLHDPSLEGSFLYAIATQFHHHPWNGLRFWDLIQPYFMFIVGVAMPYSLANRQSADKPNLRSQGMPFNGPLYCYSLAGRFIALVREKLNFDFRMCSLNCL